jgi:hypothetical protein
MGEHFQGSGNIYLAMYAFSLQECIQLAMLQLMEKMLAEVVERVSCSRKLK